MDVAQGRVGWNAMKPRIQCDGSDAVNVRFHGVRQRTDSASGSGPIRVWQRTDPGINPYSYFFDRKT